MVSPITIRASDFRAQVASVSGNRRFFADSGGVNLDGATFRSLAALSSSLPLWSAQR